MIRLAAMYLLVASSNSKNNDDVSEVKAVVSERASEREETGKAR